MLQNFVIICYTQFISLVIFRPDSGREITDACGVSYIRCLFVATIGSTLALLMSFSLLLLQMLL